jgi:microcystin-dependent protein
VEYFLLKILIMSDQFLGEIRMFATNIIPTGWILCDGTLLPVGKNTQLFSFLGTTFGGNGTTTFGIPDLRGAAALMFGQGPGLESYHWGQTGGAEAVTLTQNQLPLHTHQAFANSQGDQAYPAGNDWGDPLGNRGTLNFYATQVGNQIAMHQQAISSVGNGAEHNNLMPYTTFVFCIATEGWPPSRN